MHENVGTEVGFGNAKWRRRWLVPGGWVARAGVCAASRDLGGLSRRASLCDSVHRAQPLITLLFRSCCCFWVSFFAVLGPVD